jgi:hypothetical protein
MAKVKRNILFQGISGTIDKNLVFRQMKDGTTILSAKPDFSRRVFSKGQLTHQSRFQAAAAYARRAAKTNPIYAELAKGTMKTAYNIALSDWFNPPVIHEVQRHGEHIQVNASDNVLVAKVVITILDEQGKVLEQGEAGLQDNHLWNYALSAEGKIRVEAWDLAGNRTKVEA